MKMTVFRHGTKSTERRETYESPFPPITPNLPRDNVQTSGTGRWDPNSSATLMSWGDGSQSLGRLQLLESVGQSSGKETVAQ